MKDLKKAQKCTERAFEVLSRNVNVYFILSMHIGIHTKEKTLFLGAVFSILSSKLKHCTLN